MNYFDCMNCYYLNRKLWVNYGWIKNKSTNKITKLTINIISQKNKN